MKREPIILALIVSATSLSAQDADLAKKLANPISDLISVPIQPPFPRPPARLGQA